MTNVLVLNSSVSGDTSVSRELVNDAITRLSGASADVTLRDLGAEPVPHLSQDAVAAIRGGVTANAAQEDALALSDALVAELLAADTLVIGAPMYNFGIPSQLKAWFDYVLRPGIAFQYSEAGPKGLLTGKRAVVIETRGGLYSEGPAMAMDSQEPHLRNMLGFMGISDVTFVRAEKLAFGDDAKAAALASARAQLDAIAA
ncbi:NAD(P)H-dependent oxidoreductase [Breoghania sp. L-A4]|uniref:FMN-dependent NADH-azoreductase n=1 Tax=Breoghania sp. L-A4 TaxID=2304600 RepID=UPI000E35A4D9|nr:NAD(P)H-dependent oxidoreductase [Breoghania sp. L-A4]AXS39728.1 FMN-dependent NADH-azoreductase [Breoghania sp. L-A4]